MAANAMPAPAIRALEPRFVFDGAAAPAAAQTHSDAAAQSHGAGPEAARDTAHAEAADAHAAPVAAAPAHETATANGRHEIVVIDKGAADLATLLAGVPSSAEVILIDSARDGFDQLAETLQGRSGIDAIHILSHGSAGDLRLGTGDLTAETIQGRYAADLAIIGNALTASGDLLIYGCDFAAGSAGARAVALLASATGADIAASDDATGAAALGGDWRLEVHDGAIETGVVVSEAAQRDWQHLLAAADNGRGALLAVSGRTIYSVDIVSGKATQITQAPASVGGINLSANLNSLAVDQANGLIYYVDNASPQAANKNALFAYDFKNDRHILIDGNLTSYGVTTGTEGLGGAGAAFYNGALYMAAEDVDGNGRDQIYKVAFNGTGLNVASASTFGNQSNHNYNWGDLGIDPINNQLVSLTSVSFARFDLATGSEISFVAGSRTDFQTGRDQDGHVYSVGTNITEIDPSTGAALGGGKAITTNGSTALGGITDAAAWTPPTSTIGGRVFGDTNRNAASDSGEPGIRGVTVQLVDDVNGNGQVDAGERVLATDTSAADGSYSFTGLLPGQFVVRVTDTEGRLATATATTATLSGLTNGKVGATLAGPDFGYNPAVVLDLDDSAAGTGYATSYTERAAGVAIVDSDVSILDVASTAITSAKAVITNGSGGDALSVAGTLPSGISAVYDPTRYTLTLTGAASLAAYQTALQQIRFASADHDPATTTRTITIVVNDGTIDSNTAASTIGFTAVDDAPVNGVPGAQSVNEDTDLVFSSANGNALTVSDADARSGSLTTTLSVAHGILTLGSTGGVTVSGNGTGTVSVTGTITAINAALDGTRYRAAADYNGPETLTLATNDNGNTGSGGPQTDTDDVAITVAAVNDPPVLDLDASASGTGFRTSYGVGGPGVAIVDTDVAVTDVDNAQMASAKAVITNPQAGDGLTAAGTLPSGIVAAYDTTTYTLTLTGLATKAAYQTALQQIRYAASGPNPSTVDRTIAVTVNDGTLDSAVATATVSVEAANAAPVNSVPANQTLTENTSLAFASRNGNAITVSDPDAGASPLTTTVSVAHGTLTLGSTSGVTVTNDGTGAVTLTGTASAINTALDGTTYRPAPNYRGSDTLTVVTDDNGNTGAGGPQSDTDTVGLNVRTAESPPVNSVPAGPQAATEDTTLVFSAATGNAVRVDDPDGGTLIVTLSTNQGQLSLSRLTGLTFTAGDGADDATMTFSGAIADINAALDGLRFTPRADYNGSAQISLVTQDPARPADNFTNGGFENPAVASGGFAIVAESSVPGWKTDATDHQIEIWNSGHDGVTAYEGNQFAEINANEVAALFQTFDAAAGSTVTLDFAHRGRAGVDTMQVTVTDLGADGVAGTADDRTLFDKTYSDGNTAWGAYRETLADPTSGNKLRFEFRSVSAAGGSQSVGNFIDGIQIHQAFKVASTIDVALAPVADIVPDAVTTNEDAGIGFNALTGTNGGSADTFADATRAVTAVSQGTHGRVGFQADGTLTYTPDADFDGTDSFTYTVTAGGSTETATVTVTVRPINDAPVLGLSAAQGYAARYGEGDPGVAIVGADVSVTDVDSSTMASATAAITNGQTGDTLGVSGALPAGITARFDPATYTLTLTGAATKADYQTALGLVRFSSDQRDPPTATRSIDISVSDGALRSNIATATVAFTAVNDAPVNGLPAAQTTAEDTPLVFSAANGNGITVSDADARTGRITTTLGVRHGTLTLGSTAGVTVSNDGTAQVTLTGTVAAINAALDGTRYRPAADYNGTDTLTILTDDGGNTGAGGARTDTDTLALTVLPVNDAPRAGPLAAVGSLDGEIVAGLDLGRAFSDVEGDALAFSVAGLPPGLTIDRTTGLVSGTIDRSASRGGANGDYTVTVTADDGNGGVTHRTFTWRVVDPAPIAQDDGALTDARTPALGSVLADNGNGADSDPDADSLTVSAVNGSAAAVGQAVQGSGGGRFTVRAEGGYRFDPGTDFADLAAGQTRTTRIVYTIADGDGGTAMATLTMTVTGLAAAPVSLAPGDRAASEGETVVLPLGNPSPDSDGTAPRYGATGLPPGLAIDPATGTVRGTIDHTASGAAGLADYRVTITATAPDGSETSRHFTFRVTNPPPQAGDDTATTAEDTPVVVDVLANDRDRDGDTLSIVATGDAAPRAGHGRVAIADGKLVYTPDADFNGTDTITYAIADGNGGTSTASVTVTVTPVNDAPRAGILPDQAGRDGAPVAYAVGPRFDDPDADRSVGAAPNAGGLSFTATGLPPGLAIDPATGLITGLLPSGVGPITRYAVTVTATDADGASVSRSFTWMVSKDAPTVAADTATTRAGSPVLVAVTANDFGSDGGGVRLVDAPDATTAAHGTVSADPATGLLTYVPEAGFSGTDIVVYTVETAQGGRATGILTVVVTPVNLRPVAPEPLSARNAADGERVRVPFGNLIVDPEGARLAYAATGLPPGLAIDSATGEITGTIARDASGLSGRTTYVVRLEATDPGGLAVSRQFAWTITNPAPSATDDVVTTGEDTPLDIDVTGNDHDPDGDPLAVVPGSVTAGHGTVTINPDGSLRYTPERDFNGSDVIVYTVTDGNGGFATASVAIGVTPVNDAPVFDAASPALAPRSAVDGGRVSIPAGGAFRDVDGGDVLTFTATGLPPGLALDPATGLISGTLASDASTRVPGGHYTITLTGTDLAGATATTRFTLTVTNPAPIALDDAATLDEDGTFEGHVLDNDRDPDGDALRVDPAPVAGPLHGRLDLRPDGTFTYVPDSGFHGEDAFTYAVLDSDGGRATATVHLTVASVDAHPEVPPTTAPRPTAPPTATAAPVATREDTPVDGRVITVDRGAVPPVFTVAVPPTSGRVTLRPDGSFTYTPVAGFHGSDGFVVRVSNGPGGAVLVQVPVAIGAAGDAPDAQADPLVLFVGEVGRGRVVTTDHEGDPLGFRLTGAPANGTVVLAADGSYAYTPGIGFIGRDRFTIEVSDGNGGIALVSVAITVTPKGDLVPPPGAVFPILGGWPLFEALPAAPPPASETGLVAHGFVLSAVAAIAPLGAIGNVILADGAVLAAVNGVGDLHGSAIAIDGHPVLDEGDRIRRLAWDRFEQAADGDGPWFSPRPYLGRSLGFSLSTDSGVAGPDDLMVEAIRRPDTLAINLRNPAPDGASVVEVRFLGLDGARAPAWIEGDGKGGFWGRPPAGTRLVSLQLEVTLGDGRVVRRPMTVDAETGEIRAITPPRPGGDAQPVQTREPDIGLRGEAPLFTARLAALDRGGRSDLALIEKALARVH